MERLLNLSVVLSVTKHVFRLLDLEIEVLTLKMTFNHQNNTRNGLFGQNHIKHIYYTSCYLCLLKIIFFIPSTLELTFWPWRWPSITKNNTINVFSSQKSHRKEVLHLFFVLSVTNHILRFVLSVTNHILRFLDLEIIYVVYLWPWNWPFDLEDNLEDDLQ